MARNPHFRFGQGAALFAAGAIGAGLLASPARAQDTAARGAGPEAQEAPAKLYDETADARADIAAAVSRARRDNQRVLVMFGANWCGWCHKLHGLFTSDKQIARTLLYEYRLVLVDIGKWDKNLDVAAGYGADLKASGVPFLVVLDGDGKVLTTQNTSELEEGGDHHSPEKVKGFLAKFVARPVAAGDALDAAFARARREEKRVFLHFGAPWCPWCHRLEEFVAQPEIAALLEKDYVDLKIDVDRMTGGKDVQRRFNPGEGGGIPWSAILEPDGRVLVTSDRPGGGNIGFPVEDTEIAHFVEMLKKTARQLGAAELATVQKALEENAKRLKAARR